MVARVRVFLFRMPAQIRLYHVVTWGAGPRIAFAIYLDDRAPPVSAHLDIDSSPPLNPKP